MLKHRPQVFIVFFLSLFLYLFISYTVARHETAMLLPAYFFLFGAYLWVFFTSQDSEFNFWFYSAILFRAALLFSVPNLSDDFYRFIWDGRLLANGYHPFAELPWYYIQNKLSVPGIDQELFDNLNSQNYFTIYPPVAQFIFWISVKLFPQPIYGSLMVMKLFIFGAEMGSLALLKKLAQQFNLHSKQILLYALNPLVIIEFTGNLHFDGIMIYFLLLCLYLLTKDRIRNAAIAFAFAICTKLLPLILLPILIVRTGWKKALRFYTITFLTTSLLFLPLYNHQIIDGFRESLGYYFQKFEFNASIYYLIRQWGYWYYGFNIIQTSGKVLALISTALILFYSFYLAKNFPIQLPKKSFKLLGSCNLIATDWIFIFLIYFLFTTTLHPWYITILIALSVFSAFKFPVVWSALIFLTYTGYTRDGFLENLWLTALEYVVVIGYLVFEVIAISRETKKLGRHFL